MPLFIANYGNKLRTGKYQKEEKSREDSRIYRKNKEGSGRGWSSIEKSLGGNEAASRQSEKRS